MTFAPNAPAIKVVKSVREQVGETEWAVRVDLAACYRLVAMHGYTQLIANHISVAAPGHEGEFLINPYGMLYEELDASSLVRVNLDGDITFNATEYGVNRAGFVIHSAIHAARPDVNCIAHTHTPAGMAVSAMECGLKAVAQSGMRFLDVAYHDFEGIADELDERERIIADLGSKDVMVLRNHGLLVTGDSIAQCWARLFAMERACETQIAAMTASNNIVVPPKPVLDKVKQQFRQLSNLNRDLVWPAMLRKLDRADTSYRN